jgi:hypothetical protein
MKPFTEFLLEFMSDDAKNVIKQIEAGQVKEAKLVVGKDWQGRRRNNYIVTMHDDSKYTITPWAATTYAKASSRLRDAGKTKKEIYIDIGPASGNVSGRLGKVFGKAVGEGAQADEKIAKARQKAIQWFQKNLGVRLGEFDFNM